MANWQAWQRIMQAWKWIKDSSEQLKLLVSVATIILVGLGYYATQEKTKSDRTLEYIDRFQQGDVQKARFALDDFWRSEEGKSLGDGVPREDFQKKVLQVFRSKPDLKPHPPVLVDFYESVAICSREGICDADSACAFFFEGMQAFRCTYKGYLEDWSSAWGQNVFQDAEQFLKSCRKQRRKYLQDVGKSPNEPLPCAIKFSVKSPDKPVSLARPTSGTEVVH